MGRFFALPVDLVPEAFQDYYRSAAARAETVTDRGGCKGVQARRRLRVCQASAAHQDTGNAAVIVCWGSTARHRCKKLTS